MPPLSRRQRLSRVSKQQSQQRKNQHVSDEQGAIWLPDQVTESSSSGESLSTGDYTQKVQVLQDQLDEATTKETKENKIRELIVTVFGFEPRPKQLEALVCVIVERKDLILVAKTSFGKSLIPQAVPLLLRGQVIICILPLNVIGEEQVEKVARLPGAKPIHIRADNVDQNGLLLRVSQGEYTHVYVSPELLVGPKFQYVLRNVTFRNHVALVVVDELHLVHDWEKFRKSYAQLFTVKMCLGTVPWVGLTATCDDVTMQSIDQAIRFRCDRKLIRTDVDRPEVSILCGRIKQKEFRSFKSLYFITKGASLICENGMKEPTPSNIEKTLVFFDTKEAITLALHTVRRWLTVYHGYSAKQNREVVKGYNASLSTKMKRGLYTEFRKSDSLVRILLTTDAMAHGADVPDVTLCVQYGMFRDKSINMMWQRLGRAVRTPGMRGRFAFLVEQVYDGERRAEKLMTSRKPRHQFSIPQPSQGDGSTDFLDDTRSLISATSEASLGYEREVTPGGRHIKLPDKFGAEKKYQRKSPTERRTNLPETIYLLVNPAGQCLREMILKHYKQEVSQSIVRCCSVCCPELLDELESEPATTPLQVRRRKAMVESVEAWLNGWINEYYVNRKPFWVPDYACLISKKQLSAICSGEIIADEDDLFQRIPGWDPSILGPELQSFIIKLREAYLESKRPAPKKRRATGAVPQINQHKRHCGRSQLSHEVVLDTNAENVQSQTHGLSRLVHPGGSQTHFESVLDPLSVAPIEPRTTHSVGSPPPHRPALTEISGNSQRRPYILRNQ